jgi:predicted nucleic acid-binding protein
MKNQARFIQEIMDQKLVVSRKKKAVIIEELRERKYETFVKQTEAKTKSEEEDDANAAEEASEETSLDDDSRGYDYLLSVWPLLLRYVLLLTQCRCLSGLSLKNGLTVSRNRLLGKRPNMTS